MDANAANEIIMNDNSDMSDFNQSSEDEDMVVSFDSDINSDPSASSATRVPGPRSFVHGEKVMCVTDCK